MTRVICLANEDGAPRSDRLCVSALWTNRIVVRQSSESSCFYARDERAPSTIPIRGVSLRGTRVYQWPPEEGLPRHWDQQHGRRNQLRGSEVWTDEGIAAARRHLPLAAHSATRNGDQRTDSCAAAQTLLPTCAQIRYAFLLPSACNQKGSKMYIGGGIGLVLLIVIVVMLVR